MRILRDWTGRALIVVIPIAVAIGLTPRLSTAACVLIPQADVLENALGRRIIGGCVSAPVVAPNGDVAQPTSTGLVVVRGVDGNVAFTDGLRTWVDGPSGVQRRFNVDRFGWETVVGDIAPTTTPDPGAVDVSLDDCIRPGVRPPGAVRESCSELLTEVIDATTRRATGPVLTSGTHHVFRDWRGVPVAYVDDGTNAFAYGGGALFYVDRDLVFSYPGDFIGWIVDGVVRDKNGDAILAIDDSLSAPSHPPISPEPSRTSHRAPPKRATREIPPLQPPMTTAWTRADRLGVGF